MPAEPPRKVVSKACDACRRRKVKCNGLRPCAGCLSAELACTFESPRGLGGNRGARATVLNELRAKSQHRDAHQPTLDGAESTPSPDTPLATFSTPTARPENLVNVCLREYVEHIHPVVPLLNAEVIETHARQADTSSLASPFILAFCAYVCGFGGIHDGRDHSTAISSPKTFARNALESAITARNVRMPTLSSPLVVYSSFYLYGACAAQGNYQEAWYYLREATTLFMMLKPQPDPWYDNEARCCLFWVLVVSERYAIILLKSP